MRRALTIPVVLDVLLITFPFFALVLFGYLATRGGVLPQPAIPGLNAFVLFFALPCLLYRFGAQTPIDQLLDPAVAGVYSLCAVLMVGGAVLATRGPRTNWNDAAFGALVAAFPNTGFMGVPLLVALLGAMAAGPAIMSIMIDMVLTTSLCIALSRLDGAGTHGMSVAVKKAMRGMLTNPMPWSIALGAVASAMAFQLPGPVDKTVAMLADAASGIAVDPAGDPVFTGFKSSAIDFGGGLLSQVGPSDVVIVKLKGSDGSHLWSFGAGGASYDSGNSVAFYGNDPIVAGSYRSSDLSFGGGTLPAGSSDAAFVVRLTGAAGAHVASAGYAPTLGKLIQRGMAVSPVSHSVVICGYMDGTTSIGASSLTSVGGRDAFIASFGPLP